MTLLDDILAPVGRERFFADFYRKQPLYIPAHAELPVIFSFEQLSGLVAQSRLWDEKNLRMWIDKKAIPPEQYSSPKITQEGLALRPDPTKVEDLFAKGASLVLNHADDLTPDLRAVANMLENEFLGHVSANIYASNQSRQAFDSHYDDHEVFSFHVEGEKKWRIYQGRMDNPVGQPSPRPNLQQLHDQAKGGVAAELTMRPGDFLYLPRGQYHDALASSSASLHVTFSVIPLNGLGIFDLLQAAAVRDSLFRDDLPNPGHPSGKAALAARLADLGVRLDRILHDPAFIERVMAEQKNRIRHRGEVSIGGKKKPPEAG